MPKFEKTATEMRMNLRHERTKPLEHMILQIIRPTSATTKKGDIGNARRRFSICSTRNSQPSEPRLSPIIRVKKQGFRYADQTDGHVRSLSRLKSVGLNCSPGRLLLLFSQSRTIAMPDTKMTPEEIAQKLLNGMFTGHAELYRDEVLAAIRFAVKQERREWKPIETCPRHEDVLFWRNDQSISFGQYTYCAEWVSEEEQKESQYDEDTLWKEDVFVFTHDGAYRCEGDEQPTYWMPLPEPPEE